MKRISTIILLLCTAGVVVAQPQFSNSQNVPAVGYTFPVKSGSLTAGSAGTNMTWDFSSATFMQVGTATFVDAATTPYSTIYSAATHAFKLTSGSVELYNFIIVNSDSMATLGADIAGFSGKDYRQNPSRSLIFPFNYGDNYYEEYKKQGSSMDFFTATYDGYGTVMIDGKTYNNVARVNYNYSGDTDYVYWNMNPLFPLLIINSNNGATYMDHSSSTLGIELNSSAAISVYPVPAKDHLYITSADNRALEIILYNAIGAAVLSEQVTGSKGILDVSALPEGIYFYEISSEGKRLSNGTIILN